MSGKRIDLAVRFWRRVNKDGPIHPSLQTRCWLWTGCIDQRGGYGRVSVDRAKPTKKAHRIAFELTHGPLTRDQLVLHRCDIPRCCNPDHLFLGTQRDNVYDAISKGRHTIPHRTADGLGRLPVVG